MEHNIIFWSGGKDSTATIILAKEHNIPIDRIVFAEVMFSHEGNISGENPDHIKWIKETAIPKIESWGYKVDIVRSDKDYIYEISGRRISAKSKHIERVGKKYGFPLPGMCVIQRDLKIAPVKQYKKELQGKFTEIVGIATDEPKRLKTAHAKGQRSLMEEYGLTEKEALNLCKEYNLLSPIYQSGINRGGVLVLPQCHSERVRQHKREVS